MKINNIFRILYTAAIAVSALSCSKDYDIIIAPDPDTGVPVPPTGGYRFAVSAGHAGDVGTRAVLDGIYKWEAGDNIGLVVAANGGSSPLAGLNGLLMTGDNTETTNHTTFTGQLDQTNITSLTPTGSFDYYSYFPYELGTPNGSLGVSFSVPATMTLAPNVFSSKYAPMTALPVRGEEAIMYWDGEQDKVLSHSGPLHFEFGHVLSYAAIGFDDIGLSPSTQTVTSIEITSVNGTPLWGTYNYNLATDTGSGGYTGGSATLTVNITGGITVGSTDVVYVPMPPADISGNGAFMVKFYYASGNPLCKLIPGATFTKGYIHRLRVVPPAEYSSLTSGFTVTEEGYYYVEAWGGNGGNSNNDGADDKISYGGAGGVKRGLYHFEGGAQIEISAGRRGSDSGEKRNNAPGGQSSIAVGGQGARGGVGNETSRNGYAGAGGGGASGIKVDGTVWLAAGGGGGGGGLPSSNLPAGVLGSSWSYANLSPMPGDPGSDIDKHEDISNHLGETATGPAGAPGKDGQTYTLGTNYAGGGGGGGGGGWIWGGYGGPGGNRGGQFTANNGKENMRGGGGAGGMNYNIGNTPSIPAHVTTSDNTLPADNDGNGYVIITFFRP